MPKKPTTKEDKEAAYDDLEMSVLYKISRAVAQRKNVHDLITETLDILDGEMGLMRGTVTLRDGDYLFIEAAAGMDAESIRRGVYKIGEGVTGLSPPKQNRLPYLTSLKTKDFWIKPARAAIHKIKLRSCASR